MQHIRFQEQAQARNNLADTLAADYAADLPRHVTDRAFSLAWEHGHACGEGEVENYYVDFADLAGDAYRAGLSDKEN